MGTLGDVKDLATLGALGVVAYLVYSFVKDPTAPIRKIIETTQEVTSDIIERREDFGIPGSLSPPGYEGGEPLTPGWTGEPPSGSAGMVVYADKFAEFFGLTPGQSPQTREDQYWNDTGIGVSGGSGGGGGGVR
jgi:hypothetical protein